jgi:hypothetical protein
LNGREDKDCDIPFEINLQAEVEEAGLTTASKEGIGSICVHGCAMDFITVFSTRC